MKKTLLKTFLFLSFLGISSTLSGQPNTTNPVFKGAPTFGGYLEWLLDGGSCAPAQFCEQFIGFIKFKVDADGAVPPGSINMSDNIQGCLKSAIREVIWSTHGQWEPMKIKGKAVDSPELLQIVFFRLEGACTIDDDYRPDDILLNTFEKAYSFRDMPQGSDPVLILPLATVYFPTGATEIGDVKKKN